MSKENLSSYLLGETELRNIIFKQDAKTPAEIAKFFKHCLAVERENHSFNFGHWLSISGIEGFDYVTGHLKDFDQQKINHPECKTMGCIAGAAALVLKDYLSLNLEKSVFDLVVTWARQDIPTWSKLPDAINNVVRVILKNSVIHGHPDVKFITLEDVLQTLNNLEGCSEWAEAEHRVNNVRKNLGPVPPGYEKIKRKKSYYFTFGSNHVTEDGRSLGSCYVRIVAFDEREARKAMVELRGDKWAFCYSSAEAAGVDRFGLTVLDLGYVWLPEEKRRS